uniref:Reverse transcriptase domain-containing protein n=1 Tax=Tanacetum cinerariifolium TaxID=118510 RepID=A0A699GMQ9_TANCI|nr:reverse transcriptase domain-containing protein [Tanacetum cinerariifolium]
MDENHLVDVIEVYKQIDLNKEVIEQENKLESDGDDDLPDFADPDNVAQEIKGSYEVIPSSKEIKFKCFRLLESKLEEKKKDSSIDQILEEDFDAILDEGSKFLHFTEGTIHKEKLFPEFNEFMEMIDDENFESESDTEEPPFEKITFNTNYKIKTSLEKPPTDLELKPLSDNLEYVFLEEPSFLPVIISSQLSEEKKSARIFS